MPLGCTGLSSDRSNEANGIFRSTMLRNWPAHLRSRLGSCWILAELVAYPGHDRWADWFNGFSGQNWRPFEGSEDFAAIIQDQQMRCIARLSTRSEIRRTGAL